MTKDELFEIYKRERMYQTKVFGEYKDNPSLNVGSLLIFLENYVNKAKTKYMSSWTSDLPSWMIASKESISQKTCPVETYEDLIKIFAFAGAALESYTKLDVKKWREIELFEEEDVGNRK